MQPGASFSMLITLNCITSRQLFSTVPIWLLLCEDVVLSHCVCMCLSMLPSSPTHPVAKPMHSMQHYNYTEFTFQICDLHMDPKKS